jgi:SHAQKYF class myb-like DNA-binding protein
MVEVSPQRAEAQTLKAGRTGPGKTAAQGGAKSPKDRKKAGVPWTPEEHKRFLLGLSALGKGDWRGISRHYVQTRTPTQVASHAQKYFIRQTSTGNKRKRRTSLFDTTLDSIPATKRNHSNNATGHSGEGAMMNRSQSGGSLESDPNHQPCSASPSNSTEAAAAAAANAHVRIMPVGILAKGRGDHGTECINGNGRNGNGSAAAVSQADFSAALNQTALQQAAFPQLGMFPQFLLAQAALSQFSQQLTSPQQLLNPLAAAACQASQQQQQTNANANAVVAAQVFKPMAVRYSNKEVQKFKKEWNGSFSRITPNNNPANRTDSGENKLGTHIRKVYKLTKELEPKQTKVPAHSSLSNQSANTLTSL